MYARVESSKLMSLSKWVGDADDWYNPGTVTTGSDTIGMETLQPSMHTSPRIDCRRAQDTVLPSFIPVSHLARSMQPPQESASKTSVCFSRSRVRKKRKLSESRSVDVTIQARTPTNRKGKANDHNKVSSPIDCT